MSDSDLNYYASRKDQFQWQEGEYTVTRTSTWSGPGCHNGCGVVYYTKDNKLVKVEGDPNNPFNQGRLCMRCLAMPEAVNHDSRLKYPVKRVGKRGENKWERVSWDQAYNIIEEKVRGIWKDYGAESIVSMIGTGRNNCWQIPYLSYAAFGSPNFCLGFLSGDSCFMPRAAEMAVTNGDFLIADCSQQFEDRYNNPQWKAPEVILIWGNNTIVSNADGFFGHWVVELMRKGSKLIVVDPALTWLASKADYWLQIRPGTDAALGMAMLDVIIKEELYDKEFVEKWTFGFEKLAERVAQWPPEKVAEITWIPKDTIVAAARMYANAKPAAVQWGLAVDQSILGISTAQTINALWSITGNVDIPGGNIVIRNAFDQVVAYNYGLHGTLSEEMIAKRLGSTDYPMKAASGFSSTAHGDSVLKAIESGKPYPVRMLWLTSTNPIANMAAEAPRVYSAIRSVDFVVVADLFMTPTAVAFADVVLPCAMSCERDTQRVWWTPMRTMTKVSQHEDCKTDDEIVTDLGKRLKPENFPWDDDRGWSNHIFKHECTGIDIDFETLEKKVYVYPPFDYKKHEKGLLRFDGEPGFNTATGKIELYNTYFEGWGYDPLPWYQEPPESPYSTPELFKEYPLVLTTGARSFEFFHSEHRQLKTMREFHPDPLVEINNEKAAELGIQDGDWVWIENMRGRCKQKAKLTVYLHPKVVRAEHGWWFPEKEGAEPSLFGVFDSNINNLTQQMKNGPTGYGAPYKNQICKLYKVTEENSQDMPSKVVTQKGGFGYVK